MMNMMYTTGGLGFGILWGLHVVSVIAFFTGVLFLIVLAVKTFTHAQLKTWALWLMIVGAVACLFTISVMGHPWGGYKMGGFGGRSMPMMGQWQGLGQNNGNAAQQQEEAEGKALYEKLQAKQTTCADLSDSDFELIGEYAMSQQAGASHEQMNAMMKQMMGQEGEEQMHIILGRNAAGCEAAPSSL